MTPAASKSTALERADSNGSDAKSATSTPDAAAAAQHKAADAKPSLSPSAKRQQQ